MRFLMENFRALPRLVSDNCSYFFKKYRRSGVNHESALSCVVPDDFFGICVAPGTDSGYIDFLIDRLKELDIRHVRVDLLENQAPVSAQQLIDRLEQEKIGLCLHLVQRPQRAALAVNLQIRKQWRSVAVKQLDRFGKKVEFVEIGSTVNRRNWSGYSLLSYLSAWQTVYNECRTRDIPVAGPNVTDFEPFYNVAILSAMKRMDMLPDIHTNNLFVERASEPESFDPKIAGAWPAGILKFNMIKKAKLLGHIANVVGVKGTMSTHVSWSLRRIGRILADVEEQQADYVSRYACLAAVSGALNRVYWGPLIGQREGLIDDGTDFFPEMPHVTFYEKANGKLDDYRIRPAFNAFKTVVSFLAGSEYEGRAAADQLMEIHRFRRGEEVFHMVWIRNGLRAVPSECYADEALNNALFYSRDGLKLDACPVAFGESPVFIVWPAGRTQPLMKSPHVIRNVTFARRSDRSFTAVSQNGWYGIVPVDVQGAAVNHECFMPDSLSAEEVGMLRDSRNRIWLVKKPWDEGMMVVKYYRPRNRARRILNLFRDGKARRSWNNSNELQRRGINTAEPLAFLEQTMDPLSGEGFFISDYIEPMASVRDAFTAFRDGVDEFKGVSRPDLYGCVARFLLLMHQKGVFFRDLSAGNILLVKNKSGVLDCFLIDTARAVFYNKTVFFHRRLADLVRICHPMDWNGRNEFLSLYMRGISKRFDRWMRVPFLCYDWKHRGKKIIRALFPKKKHFKTQLFK